MGARARAAERGVAHAAAAGPPRSVAAKFATIKSGADGSHSTAHSELMASRKVFAAMDEFNVSAGVRARAHRMHPTPPPPTPAQLSKGRDVVHSEFPPVRRTREAILAHSTEEYRK